VEIDFSVVLKDIKGAPLHEAQEPGGKPEDLTLGAAAVGAMLAQEQNCEGKEKFLRWDLARKIQEGLDAGVLVDLTAADVAKVRKQIGKLFAPVVVGGAWSILDGMKKKPKKADKAEDKAEESSKSFMG